MSRLSFELIDKAGKRRIMISGMAHNQFIGDEVIASDIIIGSKYRLVVERALALANKYKEVNKDQQIKVTALTRVRVNNVLKLPMSVETILIEDLKRTKFKSKVSGPKVNKERLQSYLTMVRS